MNKIKIEKNNGIIKSEIIEIFSQNARGCAALPKKDNKKGEKSWKES